MYVGRFAPSPTGPLHFGSIVAATSSYLEARSRGGEWLVRIEDVDVPRNVPGAADLILRQLVQLGFRWDGEVLYQSRRQSHYQAALDCLLQGGHAYPCSCSRREIALVATPGVDGAVYPGTCRGALSHPERPQRAIRLRVPEQRVCVEDGVQGSVCQSLAKEVGDFVVLRADGLFAYQLAVVVDDELQGVTHIVRGADLLDSTPRQHWLRQCLGYTSPISYMHVPVATNPQGEKLSKQTLAASVDTYPGVLLLLSVFQFLGMKPEADVRDRPLSDIWSWAIAHWSSENIPRVRTSPVPDGLLG